jgi:hypothetical protein
MWEGDIEWRRLSWALCSKPMEGYPTFLLFLCFQGFLWKARLT